MPKFTVVNLLAATVGLIWLAGCEQEAIEVKVVPKEPPPPTPITWVLPANWRPSMTQEPSMRFATLLAGQDNEQVEITITRMSGQAGGIAQNLARWRSQVGLAAPTRQDLDRQFQFVEAGAGTAILVDMTGPGPPDANAPESRRLLAGIYPTDLDTWFAKMMAPAAQVEEHADAFKQFARSIKLRGRQMPPWFNNEAEAPEPPSTDRPSAPAWTVPDDWSTHEEPRIMAAATFRGGLGADAPVITVTPLAGTGGGLLANLNRWRGQVGLDPVDSLDAQEASQILIDDQPSPYFNLASPNPGPSPSRRLLIAVLQRSDRTWFFKMDGGASQVEQQKLSFELFVQSVRFDRSAPDPPTS